LEHAQPFEDVNVFEEGHAHWQELELHVPPLLLQILESEALLHWQPLELSHDLPEEQEQVQPVLFQEPNVFSQRAFSLASQSSLTQQVPSSL